MLFQDFMPMIWMLLIVVSVYLIHHRCNQNDIKLFTAKEDHNEMVKVSHVSAKDEALMADSFRTSKVHEIMSQLNPESIYMWSEPIADYANNKIHFIISKQNNIIASKNIASRDQVMLNVECSLDCKPFYGNPNTVSLKLTAEEHLNLCLLEAKARIFHNQTLIKNMKIQEEERLNKYLSKEKLSEEEVDSLLCRFQKAEKEHNDIMDLLTLELNKLDAQLKNMNLTSKKPSVDLQIVQGKSDFLIASDNEVEKTVKKASLTLVSSN